MNKTQLDNLIYFCFNFHSTMGVDVMYCSPDYILEKWDKYIGFRALDNEGLSIQDLNATLEDDRKYHGMVGFSRQDKYIVESLLEWNKKWTKNHQKDYNEVKEALYFIFLINTKGFTTDPEVKCWRPSGIVNTFEEYIGSKDRISKESYTHLHENLKREIGYWLETIPVNRDYKLCSLID